MEKFDRLEGLVTPLDRVNVDTDAIIPKQFLKSIKRSGFGQSVKRQFRPSRTANNSSEPGLRV